MADTQYDLVVIGSGPGGYVCAIRAAQLGMKVACVEKMPTLGGTCLNVGCIPSKALLQASEKFEEAQHGLGAFGVKVSGVSLDLKGLMGHKDKVVSANTKGVEFLFKKNKVDRLEGTGRVAGAGTVTVKGKDGKDTTLKTKNIVIATGSDSMPLKGVEVDEKKIVSSTGALALDGVPKTMVVIGGGYIGLEMGSVWQRLGSKVTVVEFLDRILPGMDGEVSSLMQRILGKQGVSFKLGTKVTGAKVTNKGVSLTLEAAKGGSEEKLEVDVVLLSIGRRAYTDGLGLKEAGVNVDERGRVVTDKHFQSNVPGIYAIGDVIAGPMLAHKAEDEGVAVAEILAGQAGHVNYDAIPGVVYTWPEAATVGKTEEQLKAENVAYKTGKFPFTANGRARAMNSSDGFVKILADKATDRVLGVHIVGPDAGHLIAECVLGMEYGASAEDIARTCHAHPTLSEAVKEAALAVDGRPIHI
ncbi:MAG: dihydrolipoyl dehydrogenase [Alphaproteobacteria bacterium]|nr:dihydrolipoyl dehydrogenase [Alphaproteobacteria bacterium]